MAKPVLEFLEVSKRYGDFTAAERMSFALSGSVVVPPDNWFHQHFNMGREPARYLALRWGSKKFKGLRTAYGVDEDVKKGGSQIEHQDEEPRIHREFEATLAKNGARCAMGNYHPLCTQKPVARAV